MPAWFQVFPLRFIPFKLQTYIELSSSPLIAAQAGELGIEMMVLDDGWFGKRDDDNSGLGDWFVNEKKIRAHHFL